MSTRRQKENVITRRLMIECVRRVCDEIFEGTGIKDGKVVGNTLYKYEIEKNIYDADGLIERVVGHHKKVCKMSDALVHRLRYGGASEDMLKQFM